MSPLASSRPFVPPQKFGSFHTRPEMSTSADSGVSREMSGLGSEEAGPAGEEWLPEAGEGRAQSSSSEVASEPSAKRPRKAPPRPAKAAQPRQQASPGSQGGELMEQLLLFYEERGAELRVRPSRRHHRHHSVHVLGCMSLDAQLHQMHVLDSITHQLQRQWSSKPSCACMFRLCPAGTAAVAKGCQDHPSFLLIKLVLCPEHSTFLQIPRFNKTPLDLAKLWDHVSELGGYDEASAEALCTDAQASEGCLQKSVTVPCMFCAGFLTSNAPKHGVITFHMQPVASRSEEPAVPAHLPRPQASLHPRPTHSTQNQNPEPRAPRTLSSAPGPDAARRSPGESCGLRWGAVSTPRPP